MRLRSLAATTDEAVFSGQQIDSEHSERVWTEALAAVEVATAAVTGLRRILSRYRVRKARDWATKISKQKTPPQNGAGQ